VLQVGSLDRADDESAFQPQSAGTYACTKCTNRLAVQSTKHLPPCPVCGNGEWRTVSGGDSVDDPYPARAG
jgi:predicted RNA-binding Zn-ribbon protein involved in translation (DUF1610 family)